MADFIQRTMRIRIEFTEPILGAVPKDEEIYTSFIASKAPDAETAKEEIERIGVTDMVDKGTTGFLMDDEGEPVCRFLQLEDAVCLDENQDDVADHDELPDKEVAVGDDVGNGKSEGEAVDQDE